MIVSAQVLCGRCGALLSGPSATCAVCGAAPVTGQAGRRASSIPVRKSPFVAAALSALLPGLGHLYLGRLPKGFAYLAGIGALEFFGFDLDLTAVGALAGVPMELGGFGIWLYGIADAYRTAKLMERGLA